MLEQVSEYRRKVGIWLSVAALAIGAFTLFPVIGASADSINSDIADTQVALRQCQLDLQYATTNRERADAEDCIAIKNKVLAGLTQTSPTPTPSITPTTIPPTPTPTPTPTVTPTPTPTPTITPTPTPTSTPEPPSMADIKASAGVPSGTLLSAFTGTISSNHTYTAVKFSASQIPTNITASNITFRNCTFARGTIFSGNNITIDHCAITGNGSGLSFSGSDNVIFTNNTLTGWDDGLHITADSGPTNNYTVTGNWIHAPTPSCSDHSDGVQILGVNGAVFRSNIIDLGPWIACGPLNGAFQIEITQGPVNNVVMDWNYLDGGGFTLRVYSGCTLIHITNNHFGTNAHWGPFDILQAGSGVVEFSGNVDVNGNLLPKS